MAVINGNTQFAQHGVLQSVWTPLGDSDTGTPEQLSRFQYHSILMAGTAGGATITVEGSEDGVSYITLKDVNGSNISATVVPARFDMVNVPMHTRPKTASGSGTSVTVTITSKGTGN